MSFLSQSKDEKRAFWLNERRNGIGGSEVAIILGISPWRTPYSLWLEKTGQDTPEDISNLPHVQRGVLGEKIARHLLEQKYLKSFTPKTWHIEGTPYRCSDDGYSDDLSTILEIKCMSTKAHDEFKKTLVIPEHYRVQCQWNLFVSKAARCLFVSFNPETEDLVELEVLGNEQEHNHIKQEVDKFWDLVQSGKPPALGKGDVQRIEEEDFEADSNRYWELKDQIKKLQEELTQIEIKLHNRCADQPGIMGKTLKVTRYERAGSIDYEAAKKTGIDLEKYRKSSTICYKISKIRSICVLCLVLVGESLMRLL